MEKLYKILEYEFADPSLLDRALRHRSIGKNNNERLEFLGDAILGCIISEELYKRFPQASEGELSRIRSELVQQATLAGLARELRLGEHLVLGPGELKSGGSSRESILADAFEALVCALYLDAGMTFCTSRVLQWFTPVLVRIQGNNPGKDPKTRLQELLQANKAPLPVYTVTEVKGKDHQQTFVVSCLVQATGEVVTGAGISRKHAEQNAALAALQRLGSPNV